MSTRRSTVFYGLLVALVSVVAGMVLASRLGLSPHTSAQALPAPPPANSAPINGPIDSTTFRNIAREVSPAVVSIRTESMRQTSPEILDFFGGPLAPFLGPGPEGQPRQRPVPSAGSGFIIDKSGLILTNNHVVEGTTKIQVSLFGEDDDQLYNARVVGTDLLTDSALIQLTDKVDRDLTEIKFGDSDQIEPGDWVVAIGNPFAYSHTISVGVVSGIGRVFPVTPDRTRQARVIQTDAAINPGNSGGPLLNVRGEVIGINTAIYSDARQGNIGIGFAMPINLVRDILPQLRTGKVTRGRIGIELENVRREDVDALGLKNRDGAMVSSVFDGSAADKAGVAAGDVIVRFGDRPVRRTEDLVSMVTATRPGTTVPMVIVRDSRERNVSITIDELDLEAEGTLARSARESSRAPVAPSGFPGIRLRDITPDIQRQLGLDDTRGALIQSVDPDSAVGRTERLQPGDVIVRVGNQPVQNAAEAQAQLAQIPSGGSALLWLIRDGRQRFVSVTKE